MRPFFYYCTIYSIKHLQYNLQLFCKNYLETLTAYKLISWTGCTYGQTSEKKGVGCIFFYLPHMASQTNACIWWSAQQRAHTNTNICKLWIAIISNRVLIETCAITHTNDRTYTKWQAHAKNSLTRSNDIYKFYKTFHSVTLYANLLFQSYSS